MVDQLSIMFLLGSFIFVGVFISGRNHLLGTLLSLEGLMLLIFGILCWSSNSMIQFNFYLLIFLTFVACEGALALSLLVVSVR